MSKHIIILGGGALGFAVANKLMSNDICIDIFDKNTDRIKEIDVCSIGNITCHSLDIFNANFEQMIKKIGDNNQIIGLVNTIGISPKKNGKKKFIEDIEGKEWDEVLDINLKSVFIACKTIVPYMKQYKNGKIVNVSSLAGRTYSTTAGLHYCASKAAIIGLTKELAFELASYNILVNAVAPSKFLNPNWESINNIPLSYIESIPLGNVCMPEEVAEVICFLLSEKNTYITGATIDVNGGMYMG